MCGHWAGSGLSENMPRNSSRLGRTATTPWAWWSTAGIAQSASASARLLIVRLATAPPQYFWKCPCCSNASSAAE